MKKKHLLAALIAVVFIVFTCAQSPVTGKALPVTKTPIVVNILKNPAASITNPAPTTMAMVM